MVPLRDQRRWGAECGAEFADYFDLIDSFERFESGGFFAGVIDGLAIKKLRCAGLGWAGLGNDLASLLTVVTVISFIPNGNFTGIEDLGSGPRGMERKKQSKQARREGKRERK